MENQTTPAPTAPAEQTNQPVQLVGSVPPVTPASQAAPSPVEQPRQRGLEFVIPINRNPLAVAAGYVALFNIPFIVTAPVALGLGIAALVSLRKHPEKAGRGRAWFAVIYSAIVMAFAIYYSSVAKW